MKNKDKNTTNETARVKEIQGEAAEMARTLRAVLARSKALAKELERMPAYKAAIAALDEQDATSARYVPFNPERVRYASSLPYELAGDLLAFRDVGLLDYIETLKRAAKLTPADCRKHDEQEHAIELERRKAVAA